METGSDRMRVVTLRDGRQIGDDRICTVVAEAGINHDGEVDIALDLCRAAQAVGTDYVKFQKKTPRLCVPKSQWDVPKLAPWGETLPYIAYKERMELSGDDYGSIAFLCRELGIGWTASVWDLPSLEFLLTYEPPFIKVPSACLTDMDLLRAIRRSGRPAVLSTGMSTLSQVKAATAILGPDRLILLHCRSTYPCPAKEMNLLAIRTLMDLFPVAPVGLSNHYPGLWMALCAVAMGASMVEAHLTLDRARPGTDHAASWEPQGLGKFVQQVRRWEEARGDGQIGPVESERAVLHKLRRFP